MATKYTIQAQVVDIKIDMPKPEDRFLVDTNVWYWMTYTRASQRIRPPAQYQSTSYPAYTNTALNVGARIFQSGLMLAELTHLIEKAGFEIFAQANPTIFRDPKRFDKDFRHSYNAERSQVVAEIQAVWAQVEGLAESLFLTIDLTATADALNRLQSEKVDGYDLFILETMKKHGIKQVITDDGDFATVPGIQVFTANQNIISAASSQGMIMTR